MGTTKVMLGRRLRHLVLASLVIAGTVYPSVVTAATNDPVVANKLSATSTSCQGIAPDPTNAGAVCASGLDASSSGVASVPFLPRGSSGCPSQLGKQAVL